MPNNVETSIWLVKPVGDTFASITDEQVEDFFSQFISTDPCAAEDEGSRFFDFNLIIPQPDNIWNGSVLLAGSTEDNLALIEQYGGLEQVRKNLNAGKSYPETPCLSEEQIEQFGLVNGFLWIMENWETKWGAYNCQFDWGLRYLESWPVGQVVFHTAWSVPEKILRMVRAKALESGFDIIAVFAGELEEPGEFSDGQIIYWNAIKNKETGEPKYVPKALKTPELCLAAVQRNAWVLEFVPITLRTAELCLTAVRDDITALQYVPENLKTPEFCLAAVQSNGYSLQYVPKKLKTAELCRVAILEAGSALKYVPNKLKTTELCLTAVQSSDFALEYVPKKLKTAEFCRAAIQATGLALQYVPENLKTPELCLAAVQSSDWALEYVPKHLQTPEILRAAEQSKNKQQDSD